MSSTANDGMMVHRWNIEEAVEVEIELWGGGAIRSPVQDPSKLAGV
jgi:hypothetical protein